MSVRLAIFDFDGTLADSFPFFVQVFNRIAAHHGFDAVALDDVPRLRGYSARQVMKHVRMPSWKMPAVMRHFMSLMKEGSADIAPFPGVGDTLRHLAGAGVQLAIVTSNSRENVDAILGEWTALFAHIDCGASMFGKTSRLRKVLRKTGIPAGEAIYIGDQINDIEAARKAGIPAGAVGWGYATLESLLAHGPERHFHAVHELRALAPAA